MKAPLRLTFILLLMQVYNLSATVFYVSAGSLNPTPPYTTWATAATNIQNAIDLAGANDAVLVTNGVYRGGLFVSNPLLLVSVNGPLFTTIDGGGTNRCMTISNRTWMRGFTLTNGWTSGDGGAVWSTYGSGLLTNCIFSGNCASNGGAAYQTTLYSCLLTGNCASNGAGGATFGCDVISCTVAGNFAARGGGAFGGSLYNTILYYNTAPNGSNYGQILGITNCCTTPDPGIGEGNITNAPLFVNYAGGNLHLQRTSPCIDAGRNAFSFSGTDLDGSLRIYGGTVDIGAYEFQGQFSGPPFIRVQPFSQTANSGTDVSFNVGAFGAPPLSWQWWFNDATILNGTNASLTLPAVTTNQAGNYFVVITNALGSDTSQVAVLTVPTVPPSITEQPTNQTVYAGSNVTLVVGATGSLPLFWQWNFNGAVIPTATNSSLALPSVTTNQTGAYSVVVTNSFGSVTSHVAEVTVLSPPPDSRPPSINRQPISQSSFTGGTVTFTVAASGALPLSWQWKFNGNDILNATNSSLILESVTLSQAGGYTAVITNLFGSITSQVAVLTVEEPYPPPNFPPWIALQPISQTVTNGSTVTFTVAASGTLPLSWRWFFNHIPIGGAIGPSLTLTAVTTKQAGVYSVRVGNQFGTTPSADATLAVRPPFVEYVWQNSPNPTSPYTNWATAAHTLQDAASLASTGDLILVTNGTYDAGLVVGKQVTVRSVNGPRVTIINGGGIDRCVYLVSDAILCGFTLTNGGGIPSSYGGGGARGESRTALLTNCIIQGNSAWNSAAYGGGADNCTLYNCTLEGNSAYYGGGAFDCTLYNCFLSSNSVTGGGGGAGNCTLYNCTLTGNSALYYGGGVSNSKLYNCITYFNTSAGEANYNSASALDHSCTTPLPPGGGANIILDPQLTDANHIGVNSPCRGSGSAAYTTGTDLDGEPWGNPPSIGCEEYHAGPVTGPLSVSLLAAYKNVALEFPVSFTGIVLGEATSNVWDFGDGTVINNRPYTSHAWNMPGDYLVAFSVFNDSNSNGVRSTVTIHVGPQQVLYVAATNAKPQLPYASWATAATNIQDAVNAATIPGAQVLVTNGVYAGRIGINKLLVLQSVNGPEFTIVSGGGTAGCVLLTNGASLTGFTLTNGASDSGGGVSCLGPNAVVTNCFITGNSSAWAGGGASGGTLYACTLTGNSGTVGGGVANCRLYNCRLNTNRSSWYGAGAVSSILYNCALIGNFGDQTNGCAASGSTLYNCLLTANTGARGAAVYECELHNSTIVSNSVAGASSSALYNCIDYYNKLDPWDLAYPGYGFSYCCTWPMPDGVGNITNEPVFFDLANGDFRLQSNSPCINSGNNAFVSGDTDLDGNPRIVNGTVDIGAYEYQGKGSAISYAWLQQYGLPTDGSADYLDPDGDGMNNCQEWICGTNPTNAVSCLRLLSAVPTSTNVTLTWQSVLGVNYFLERSTNLAAPFTVLSTNLVGQAGTTASADTNVLGGGPLFYRVGISHE